MEMTAAMLSYTMHNGAKEKHTFYMKNTEEVIKRQLVLAGPHQITLRPSMPRVEGTGTIEARLVTSTNAL